MLGRMMKAMHGPVYRRRLEVLSAMIVERLRENDRVLDVGCGGGALGTAILAHAKCPRGVTVTGLERAVRGGEPIKVVAYDGVRMPFDDKSFDVAISSSRTTRSAECSAFSALRSLIGRPTRRMACHASTATTAPPSGRSGGVKRVSYPNTSGARSTSIRRDSIAPSVDGFNTPHGCAPPERAVREEFRTEGTAPSDQG
jgi:SAM-dependent methyltransferase